ncbi:MAG TPA: DoxX family protein [Jatrophihabitans sp.]
MRTARMRSADEPAVRTEPVRDPRRIRANGWPVLPLRLFLGALFCFAGYAKFSYPGFFDEGSRNGFQSAARAASEGTPLSGLMSPLVDNPSVFGHITAISEIAIGLGLIVGLLTRIAALAGMVLVTSILLSVNWTGVKEYTGSSGWFTAVDLAIAAALSIFLLGGSGPLALDNLFIRARDRQRARDEAEPSFRDSDIDDSRRRLQGDPAYGAAGATTQMPVAGGYRDGDRDDLDHPGRDRPGDRGATGYRPEDRDTTSYRPEGGGTTSYRPEGSGTTSYRPEGGGATSYRAEDHGGEGLRPADRGEAGYRTGRQDEEYRDDPEPETNSLWTEGRRGPDQPPADQPPRRDSEPPRRDPEPPGRADR